MTTPLFNFNSSAVELFSGGDITAHVNEMLMGIENEVRQTLAQQAPDADYDLAWEDGDLVVTLSDEQAESEFGRPGVQMRPVVRTALLRAAESMRYKAAIDV